MLHSTTMMAILSCPALSVPDSCVYLSYIPCIAIRSLHLTLIKYLPSKCMHNLSHRCIYSSMARLKAKTGTSPKISTPALPLHALLLPSLIPRTSLLHILVPHPFDQLPLELNALQETSARPPPRWRDVWTTSTTWAVRIHLSMPSRQYPLHDSMLFVMIGYSVNLAQRLSELATANSQGLLRLVKFAILSRISAMRCGVMHSSPLTQIISIPSFTLPSRNLELSTLLTFFTFILAAMTNTDSFVKICSSALQAVLPSPQSLHWLRWLTSHLEVSLPFYISIHVVEVTFLDSYASHSRASSNFQTSRPASVASKRSFTSSVTDLLRRATSKRSISMSSENVRADTSSMYSVTSSNNNEQNARHLRALSKQMSESSLRIDTSGRTVDARALRTTIGSTGGSHDIATPTKSPSVRSLRRIHKSAPPSSFPTAIEPSTNSSYSFEAIPDDEHAETVSEIRHQIELVEAEGARLLDAFNGLELSTLTRKQKRAGVVIPSVPSTPIHGSSEGPPMSPSLSERPVLRAAKDIDGMSFKSNGSGRTTLSMRRTPSMKMRGALSSSALSQSHFALPRKGSISSMSIHSRGASIMQSHAFDSSSSVNLTKSNGHLPLATVAEAEGKYPADSSSFNNHISPGDRARVAAANGRSRTFVSPDDDDDEDIQKMQAELADIRRRRAEVTARYNTRLEYLRARLKGAQLREKILRK